MTVGMRSIGCGPLNPGSIYAKPAFGSNEKAQTEKSGCPSCAGAGCPACQKTVEQEKKSVGQAVREYFQPYKEMSLKRSGQKFMEGVLSPIDAIKENPLTAAAAGGIAYGINKVAKHYNLTKIPKLAIYATTAIAGFNVVKGGVNFVTGKTAEEKENSFKDIGQGAIYGGFAVWPARNVAIADNVPKVAQNTPRLKAFGELVKTIPNDARQISSGVMQFVKGNKTGIDALKTAFGPSTIGLAGAGGTEALVAGGDSTSVDLPEPITENRGSADETTSSTGKPEVIKDIVREQLEKEIPIGEIHDGLDRVAEDPVGAAAQGLKDKDNKENS